MHQQITPAIPVFRWDITLLKKFQSMACVFLFLGMMASPFGLHASGISPEHPSLDPSLGMIDDTTRLEASICAGETFVFDGDLLNVSGEYSATYVAADGTDSIVVLDLSVLPLSFTNFDVLICEGETYDFNGATYDQSGSYSVILTAENGCDSIVTLKLTVLAPSRTDLSAGICEGSEYLFQGDLLTQSGVYSVVLSNENGCDSIVTLTLSVVAFFETYLDVNICPGSRYVFGSDTLSVAGDYTAELTALGGCDSTVYLTLKVLVEPVTNVSVALCVGQKYIFYGDTLATAGTYAAVFTAVNGCDSTIVLALDFVTEFDVEATQTICTGDVYLFGGLPLTLPGVYTNTFVAQGGCDSTVTLTLEVLPGTVGVDQATICAGDSYEYGGETLTTSGVYSFVLLSENGCDSVVTFTLTVLPANTTALEASICAGDSFDFNGQILTDAGEYEMVLLAENDCDSIVTLTLNVLPTQQTTLNAEICIGSAYDYNGEILTEAGEYDFVFEGENGCDSTVTLVLSVNPLDTTLLNVNICAGETYEFDGILIADAGEYTATYADENGCDSTVILTLAVLPTYNTAIEATICDNETYAFDGQDLNDAGTYTAVLTAANGCDSTVVLTLSVLPTQNTSIAATICDGETYPYNGMVLSTSGDFVFLFGSENGCDSTVTISLTVLPNASTSLSASVCAGETYEYNGDTVSLAGDYDFVFVAENGCDSIVTLTLTVLPNANSAIYASLCEGASYIYQNDTISISGFYTYVFPAENGCDSTVTLVLEFVGSFETNLQAGICPGESYVFGNDTLTDAGNYSILLTAAGGCDSLVTLNLSILPVSETVINASICAGETYLFDGVDLDSSGIYWLVLANANGCDSTVVLNLTVLPVQNSSVEATICDNEEYAFNGLVLTDAGTYTSVLTGSNGCDSTVTLTLNVLPAQQFEFSATICANDSYDFEGQNLTQAGVYTVVLQGENGCDSTLILELEVLPLAQNSFAVSVCNGETFEYNGQEFTQSGEYQIVYPGGSANGCDSLETLFLTIFPAIAVTEVSASICEGAAYDFYGTILTATGVYTEDLSSSVGCDSTIELTLTVYPNVETLLVESICVGETYSFNGQLLTLPGTYVATLSTATGCDSTVTLQLSVNTVNVLVTVQGNTVTAQATNATYQWIDCANNQPIAGATGSSFTPAVTGNYAVIVTQNGCTATSICVLVQIVSTNEPLAQSAWNVQPNPASAFTQVVFDQPTTEDFRLDIHDMAGRLLQSQTVGTGTTVFEVDLTDLPSGVLMLRLSTESGVSTKRLVKTAR